jgi:predicted cation transporter
LTLTLATLVILLVLLGPVFIGQIERNVELFFLLVGVLTACIMGQFNVTLVWAALNEPLSFTLAVLVFGATFRLLRDYLDQLLRRAIRRLAPRILCFSLAIILGFLAAFITPVVSALVFVEAISLLRCDRWAEIAATVFACFAIGFGASLTPLGMPGIAVVLRSLHADFWYLARLLGPFIVVGVTLAAVPILFLPFASSNPLEVIEEKDSWGLVLLIRPAKVYVFIAGLVALSDGLRPLVDAYIHRVPNELLFWLNTISAVVNNSTLAAVEIGPFVAASRLGITSREWARIGLGTGALLLILCFAVLKLMVFF